MTPCNDSSGPPTPAEGTWGAIDPLVFRQGWDAAMAGRARSTNPFSGTGPRSAWEHGYADALAEREKDAPADPLPGILPSSEGT